MASTSSSKYPKIVEFFKKELLPTYYSFAAMRKRCNNPKHENYPSYGGRGIKVCPLWNNFENFLADMGVKPEGMQIDRIDVNGHYEPSNCRWVTPSENSKNRRRRQIKLVDLSGQRFGKWVVIKQVRTEEYLTNLLYECRCDCGNIGYVQGTRLRYMRSTQCKTCSCKINTTRRKNYKGLSRLGGEKAGEKER